MTAFELNELLGVVEAKLWQLSIPYSPHIERNVRINTRAKKRLGCCIYSGGKYIIEVSEVLLAPDKAALLEQTLVHELLHTCRGCRNHGEKWKAYAQLANEAYGYSIARTVDTGEGGTATLRAESVKYVLVCENCGLRIERSRMSKAVKSPWRYRCKCGGKLKRIK